MSSLKSIGLYAAIVIAALASAFALGHAAGDAEGSDRIQRRWDGEKAKTTTVALTTTTQYRAEETRRTTVKQEITHAAARKYTQADLDNRAAELAGQRLRDATAQLAARCGAAASDTAAQPASAAASSAGDLQAFVSSRLGAAGRAVADFGERASIASETCKSEYDSLNRKDPPQ